MENGDKISEISMDYLLSIWEQIIDRPENAMRVNVKRNWNAQNIMDFQIFYVSKNNRGGYSFDSSDEIRQKAYKIPKIDKKYEFYWMNKYRLHGAIYVLSERNYLSGDYDISTEANTSAEYLWLHRDKWEESQLIWIYIILDNWIYFRDNTRFLSSRDDLYSYIVDLHDNVGRELTEKQIHRAEPMPLCKKRESAPRGKMFQSFGYTIPWEFTLADVLYYVADELFYIRAENQLVINIYDMNISGLFNRY